VNGGSAVELGIISEERPKKAANLIINPEPLGDSANTIGIDFSGTIRRITLTGTLVHNTPATLAGYVQTLNTFIDGDQQNTTTYVSDMLGTLNVKIEDVSGVYKKGEPTMYEYTITMVETSTDI